MPKGVRLGGRQKGTPNKGGVELRAAAQVHTVMALRVLAEIAQSGESEQARVSAANALLDRGHGKPAQALTDADGGPLIPRLVVHEHVAKD
jgi:hypothetical protein